MNTILRLGVVASTFVALGGMTTAAQATEVCPLVDGAIKVELRGDSATVRTGLPEGVSVCVKAGTQLTRVTVQADGAITQTAITNKKGVALGISHYVAYLPASPVDEPPVDEPPVDEPPVDEPPTDGEPIFTPPSGSF